MRRAIVAGVLSVALALPGVTSAQLVGVVIGVPDGDTLQVRVDEQVVNINLRAIDAPEPGQPFASRSRQSLAELCDARTVTLDALGIDSERRIVGEAQCDGVDARVEQVKRGVAWAVERQSRDSTLKALQAEARGKERGLWSEEKPVPPWEWSAIFAQ